MARNKILDLNNHLFAQLERLEDESLSIDKLKIETERAKAISSVASQILKSARLTFDVVKLVSNGEIDKKELPDFILKND